MPVILLTGKPCCGKSTIAERMKNHFTSFDVRVISEHEECFNTEETRDVVYASAQREKIVRGKLKAALSRSLGGEKLVILDGLNYIKGFRYELFCLTKENRCKQVCSLFLFSREHRV